MKDIINIAMGELTAVVDNEVVKAVQKVGIDVDKEELLKALDLYRSLVWCRECKHSDDKPIADGRYWCNMHGSFMYYCSDGEREDDESLH